MGAAEKKSEVTMGATCRHRSQGACSACFGLMLTHATSGQGAREALPKVAEALKALLPWAEANHNPLKCDCARCEAVVAARAALQAAGLL